MQLEHTFHSKEIHLSEVAFMSVCKLCCVYCYKIEVMCRDDCNDWFALTACGISRVAVALLPLR